jgi:hypothetical protein
METVIVAFVGVTTFVLGFGYWHLTTRQNEQEARFERRASEWEAASIRVERKLDALQELVKKGASDRAPLAPPATPATEFIPPPSASDGWLVSLATLRTGDARVAEYVANAKVTVARDLGMPFMVGVYRTKRTGWFVVGLGRLLAKGAARALAAEARRTDLAADAFATVADDWELVGTAPFPIGVTSVSLE